MVESWNINGECMCFRAFPSLVLFLFPFITSPYIIIVKVRGNCCTTDQIGGAAYIVRLMWSITVTW